MSILKYYNNVHDRFVYEDLIQINLQVEFIDGVRKLINIMFSLIYLNK